MAYTEGEPMSQLSAHVDTYVLDHLPPRAQWPEFRYDAPHLRFPDRLNFAECILDAQITTGHGNDRCLITPLAVWTYRDLYDRANQIAHVLVSDLGVVPGNRVLLVGQNSAMIVACWYAVLKVGAVAVTLVPSLRAAEITKMATKVKANVVLCDVAVRDQLDEAATLPTISALITWGDARPGSLESYSSGKSVVFDNVSTSADDPCLIAFTSGSTGEPKAVVHTHREMAAVCATFRAGVFHAASDDIFVGSSPVAFTYGLLAIACFPLAVGASTVLLERRAPTELLDAIRSYAATVCFTVPTVYRTWLQSHEPAKLRMELSSLRCAYSSGEPLPRSSSLAFRDVTGLELINVLGSTEMLHAFMSTGPYPPRPGSVGKPVLGFQTCVLGPNQTPLKRGQTGRLAVKGPTGCRYLDDPRQIEQVVGGWTLTGDLAWFDDEGYCWLEGRADDIIISAGYNLSAFEVEEALLASPDVVECAIVPQPDPLRGFVLKAYVVLSPGLPRNDETLEGLQKFVTSRIAAYKCPRIIQFIDRLPRTATGKVARHLLRAAPEELTSRQPQG